MWKLELQKLSNELGVEVHVSHFPPGTSKWNKIEHRLFIFITKNWRGKPLIDRATIVNLIGSIKTEKGLLVQAELDNNIYTLVKVIHNQYFGSTPISTRVKPPKSTLKIFLGSPLNF